MSDQPLVSVVMAVYNEAEGVQAAIESLRHQTFTDFEIIIVDDGSTDHTWQGLSSIHMSRLRIHRNIPNRGQTASLTLGLTMASGRYIARHDAEDTSEPWRLEKQVALMETHPDLALVGTQVCWVDAENQPIRQFEYPTRHEDITARLKSKNSFAHGSVMIRRAALDAVGGYRADFRLAQDYDLWLRLAERYEVANLSETGYRMRFSIRMASVARNTEQNAYAALAHQLADERASMGQEHTELDSTVGAIAARYGRGFPFRRIERARNFIQWAGRLKWWGGLAARYAWTMWAYALLTWPFNLEVWKFVAREVRDRLQQDRQTSQSVTSSGGDDSPTAPPSA